MSKENLTNEAIKQNIQDLAAEKGLTLEELSVRMGKTKSYLSSAFSKSKKLVSLEILKKAAGCLDTTVCRLLGGK
jgi:transcriptional regulator with XRE-family HTH domain